MPTFYQRPLTWLLVAAFASFDALILAGAFGSHSARGLGVIVCQLFLIAQWVLFGSMHWLMRAAIALLSIVFATLILASVSSGSLSLPMWQRIVASVAIIIVSTLAGLLLAMGLKNLFRKSSSEPSSRKWQISLIEIFGLTSIVACGSWLARGAAFARQLQHSDIGMWMGVPCLTGMALASIGTRPTAMRWGGLVASILGVGCLLLVTPLGSGETLGLFVGIALLGVCQFIRSFEPTPIKRDETPAESTDNVISHDRLEALRDERDAEHLDEQV